jgi:hypothetical protein
MNFSKHYKNSAKNQFSKTKNKTYTISGFLFQAANYSPTAHTTKLGQQASQNRQGLCKSINYTYLCSRFNSLV